VAESKRIIISLPISLLEEVNDIISVENKNRSEIIREAMRFYLKEKRKSRLREEMRKGYLEMASINELLCQEAFECEEEVRITIESKLVECC
jgi:CopG family transcriptional regulator/antitoxin EndoAI